jgi:hypothetical protein
MYYLEENKTSLGLMFKEAPSKRSKHVSSGGPFNYKHDAENPSP